MFQVKPKTPAQSGASYGHNHSPTAGDALGLTGVSVPSEIGSLRRVLVHTPGREVEMMTPKTAQELLFNEIVIYKDIREGHRQLTEILSQVSEVLEVEDCLREILDLPVARAELLKELVAAQNAQALYRELWHTPSAELASLLIGGVPLRRDTLESFLSTKSFSMVALPNMYFMRDSSVVVGEGVVTARMARPVRHSESLIVRAIHQFHPRLRSAGFLLDACQSQDPELSLEGGDLLVLREDLILVGLSERTTVRALDALLLSLQKRLCQAPVGAREPIHVFVVLVPHEGCTIHLDMMFTQVAREQAVVYSPYVLGRGRSRVIKVRVQAEGEHRFTEVDDLLLGLRSVGLRLDPIVCGGDNRLHQQREQWNSGANMFAFGPGKVLSYDMHEHTARACESAGFAIRHAREVMKDPQILKGEKPLLVLLDGAELARGGGGPRCMTCPILRDPL